MRRLALPIVVLLAAAAVVAARGAEDSTPAPTATLTPTSPATVAQTATPTRTSSARPSSSPAPTLTPTPPPVAAPRPAWHPTDRAPKDLQPLQSFVLDLDTEELFSLLPGPDPDLIAYVLTWSPTNEAVVISGRHDGFGGYGVYLGRARDDFRLVYRGGSMFISASVSPDGSMLALAGQKTVVVEIASGRLLAEFGSAHQAPLWSGEGRFLALGLDSYSTVVWDRITGARTDLVGLPGAWSHRGHFLAYFAGSDHESLTLTVRDFESGRQFGIQPGYTRAAWSPDDRYLAANGGVGEHPVVNIFDMTGKDPQVRLHAAALGGWLDATTLYFSGNYCGDFDIFTVRADGTDLVNHTDTRAMEYEPMLAPAGRGILYGHTNLLRIGEGVVPIPDKGATINPRETIDSVWSPDGRYVVLSWLGGRCGPCMGMEGPTVPTWVEVFD